MCSKMFRGLLKNISKVFSGGSGKQGASENALSSKNRVKGYGYRYGSARKAARLYFPNALMVDPELISTVTSSCGRLLSYLVARFTSKQGKVIGKVDSSEGAVNTSQSNGLVPNDEGYQSTSDCSTSQLVGSKLVHVNMEEWYKRHIEAELKLQQSLDEKKHDIKNELIDDEEYFKQKGKGGRGYVKKICNVKEEQAHLIDNYLSNIKSEKKYLRFLQLDEETQLMICKIDVFRGFGYGNGFFDKLLEMFEWKSTQLEKMKKTVAELKQLEDDYRKTIDELIDENQKIIEEKDQEIDDLKKKLQAVSIGKKMGGYESCRMKGGRKDVKIEEMDEESQLMIANINALREADDKVYSTVLSMSKEQNTKV